jgi:hypothetical protein
LGVEIAPIAMKFVDVNMEFLCKQTVPLTFIEHRASSIHRIYKLAVIESSRKKEEDIDMGID